MGTSSTSVHGRACRRKSQRARVYLGAVGSEVLQHGPPSLFRSSFPHGTPHQFDSPAASTAGTSHNDIKEHRPCSQKPRRSGLHKRLISLGVSNVSCEGSAELKVGHPQSAGTLPQQRSRSRGPPLAVIRPPGAQASGPWETGAAPLPSLPPTTDEAAIPLAAKGPAWVEVSSGITKEYQFSGIGVDECLQASIVRDRRSVSKRLMDAFMGRFFPVGYPHSVSDGYLTYSRWRAVQYVAYSALSVLSTQSLLFAAGLRPSPVQATVVSWVLKDGMQHVGKLVCSTLGARVDAEPKRWRVIADLMYDVGAGLEVLSPLCPQYFLEVAGLANMAKGMALVSARSSRLPIYASFAKEGNLSDLYAKGEAISTLSNIVGLALGIRLASSVCATTQGKLVAAPILSFIHLYAVSQEMRAAPINTLNAQRTALVVDDFVKRGVISSPPQMRYRENIILPYSSQSQVGTVRVGARLREAVPSPSALRTLTRRFQNDKFLLSVRPATPPTARPLLPQISPPSPPSPWRCDMVLHVDATGEDAVKGWLMAACAEEAVRRRGGAGAAGGAVGAGWDESILEGVFVEARAKVEGLMPALLEGLKERGWHTHLFLEGSGMRAVW